MQAPKILPWVARKSGINEELALNLWRRAAGEAEELIGNCHSSDYYGLAVERFIALCEDESTNASEPYSFPGQLRWLRHQQERSVELNLTAAKNAWTLWLNTWNTLLARPKPSARTL